MYRDTHRIGWQPYRPSPSNCWIAFFSSKPSFFKLGEDCWKYLSRQWVMLSTLLDIFIYSTSFLVSYWQVIRYECVIKNQSSCFSTNINQVSMKFFWSSKPFKLRDKKIITILSLTLCLLVSSADNLCKQFAPRSGLTKCQAWSGSKLFDTDGILEIIFHKIDFGRKKHAKFPSRPRVKNLPIWTCVQVFIPRPDNDQGI